MAPGEQGGTAASSGAADAPPSGIAGVYEYSATTNTFGLRIYDAATGAVLYDGLLPDDRWLALSFVMDSSAPAARVGFSPDRRFMYYIGGDRGCDLAMLKWTSTGYTAYATIKPPTTFSSNGTCFDQPHYEDGKLVATTKDDKTQTAEKHRYAIDPSSPTTAPVDLGQEQVTKQDLRIVAPADGGKDWTATAVTTNGRTSSISVKSGWLPWPYCKDRITDTTWLCVASNNTTDPKDETPYGSVAIATVDTAAGTVVFTSVAPAARLNTVLLAPDRQAAISYSATAGFYRIDLKNPAAPVKLFDALAKPTGRQATVTPYGWI